MKKLSLLLLASVLILPGCSLTGVAVGAGASAGIAASQEGGLSRAASDARIQIEINDLWFRYSVEAFRKLDLTINNGRVLVTGVVQNPEHRVEAIRLAWQPRGVEQVINEVRVAESEGLVGFAKDTWITTRLRTALTFDSEILSINYSIDTVQGTVYLMGFAQNQAELNRVIETARTINGVNGVVSYVKIINGEELSQGQFDDQGVDSTYEPSLQPSNEPIVISPQTQQPTLRPASEPVSDQPYIIRDQPVMQENLQARELQRQRVEDAVARQRQGIESERIEWNP